MIRFIAVNMTIHFLHIEASNPPTYYTNLYIDISRLHQSSKSTLFTRSCLIRLLSSRTQHRLTLSCHLSRAPPTRAGVTTDNTRHMCHNSHPPTSLPTNCSGAHILPTGQTNTYYIQCECTLATYIHVHLISLGEYEKAAIITISWNHCPW